MDQDCGISGGDVQKISKITSIHEQLMLFYNFYETENYTWNDTINTVQIPCVVGAIINIYVV